jgi:hypothetical protein
MRPDCATLFLRQHSQNDDVAELAHCPLEELDGLELELFLARRRLRDRGRGEEVVALGPLQQHRVARTEQLGLAGRICEVHGRQ